ncbi:ABC transporter permease [Paenibacillus sp. Pae108]|uniref:ABC transporter permease n=1 Tax=Paenibacillus sp. Pae108 TaxID=2926019 RepID=UPI00211756EC|nr:ABC transporter permease [Paenibacillus sp. Pae108]
MNTLKHLLAIELKKRLSIKVVMISLAFIFLPLLVGLPLINGAYVFFRPIEVHSRLFETSAISLLFPALLVPLLASSYAKEKKDHFLSYVQPRTDLSDYVVAKGLASAIVAFVVAFLMIFIPFLFIQYVDPLFNMIQYTTEYFERVRVGTFEFLAEKSFFLYGAVYSLWVAIHGALYVTMGYLLSIYINNKFVALSIPFLWWFVGHYVTGISGLEKFSPIYTVFPFGITPQPIWTVFVPFTALILVIVILLTLIKTKQIVWADE